MSTYILEVHRIQDAFDHFSDATAKEGEGQAKEVRKKPPSKKLDYYDEDNETVM